MKKLGLILFIITTFIFQNCKDEPLCNDPSNPKCPNYDPCYNKKTVTADFEMSQMFAYVTPFYLDKFNPDIAFERDRIGFRPVNMDTSATYIWKLGSEIITEVSFVRNFANTQQTGENNIPITLIIVKQPDLKCFPNDDGRDTVTKYIHFVESPCEYLTSGDFKVLFEGDRDSVIIGVRNWFQSTSGSKFPINDSCKFRSIKLLGFDHDILPRDTGWNGTGGFQFNSKIIFTYGSGSYIGTAYNGYFRVNSKTLKIDAEYEIYHGKNEFSKRFKLNGRKIK
jgi:hypothetical protein